MSTEADVTVNGFKLSPAESMTVRVALETFALNLNNYGLGEDETGKRMAENYLRHIASIRSKSQSYRT